MKPIVRFAMIVVAATTLSACASGSGLTGISRIFAPKDPVNRLTQNMPIGGSTNPATNELLRPPGLPRQSAEQETTAAQPSREVASDTAPTGSKAKPLQVPARAAR